MVTITMFFDITKSIFFRLWLSVALVRYAADISSYAQIRASHCGESEFECRNKDCISNELLCDGRIDCIDASDESEFECNKPELECPTYAFRCQYGACIDREGVCDGKIDCSPDGSDEDPSNGCESISSSGMSYPQPSAGAQDPVSIFPEQPCLVPPRPTNGQFKLRRISDSDDFEYVDPPSLLIATDSHLVYTCDPGFKIRGTPNVRCLRVGKWSRKPVCIDNEVSKKKQRHEVDKVRCRPLGSVSTIVNCTYASGRVRSCDDMHPVRPKTKAEISCHPGYRQEFLPTQGNTVECNKDGKWLPEPIKCVPVCGKVNPDKSLITDAMSTNVHYFPWHAKLYVESDSPNGTEMVFRCDATVIQATLLVTAAHCLYDAGITWDYILNNGTKAAEFLEKLFVIAGNMYDHYDSSLHDSQSVEKHRVKNFHTTCNSYGTSNLHSVDIAILELQQPLEFSSTLLPVCLDEFGFIQNLIDGDAKKGDTSLMGLPTFSDVLTAETRPHIPNRQCTILFNATQSPFYINYDKFCASYNNETSSCVEDVINDGSGLVWEDNNHWYLMGIVSHVTSDNTYNRERMCKKKSDLVYTKLFDQRIWIQQVISHLEHFKYPPCSLFLPPFHTRTTTQAPAFASTTITTSTSTPKSTLIPTTTATATTISPITAIISTSPIPTTINTSIPVTVPTILELRTSLGMSVPFCSALSEPTNGERRLHRDFCTGDRDCNISEGTKLGLGTQLVYSCALGYKIEGNANVYCRANGNWSSIPICTEVKCTALNSASMIANCYRFEEWVDCNYPVLPYTQARISCRSGYSPRLIQSEVVECSINGLWEPDISNCVPACGTTFHRSRVFEESEITTEAYNFPWHATLYIQRNFSGKVKKDLRCGATLIQANLLLTAAHCVYNEETRTTENPKKLFILMSNIHRQYDSPLHNPHSVRRGMVKNVHVHCKYRGWQGDYGSNIALLELQERFEFFNVQLHPACLDFSGYNEQVFGLGSSGTFVGFGKTAIGMPSDVLQTITVPYISQAQCESSNVRPGRKLLISSDKFCAGFNNGTAVCLGDGGGGLFVRINGRWHVIGIVSVDLNGNAHVGADVCHGNTYTLYTRVSDYTVWILDVMFQLERYRTYPPCSRDPKPLSSSLWP